ncbi:choice-of-anchor A family protein [Singulisphaera sp. PoT]|uniref:choice-of-anchor A family protein n=1 Tax=Singulisphaera sp. PoT TaxID=3411797 RepID=UPI003BF5A53A
MTTLVLGGSFLSAGFAQAGPLGPASDYNVFILGDATQQYTDSEGRVAVGGNATYNGYSVASSLPSNTSNALVVGQSLNFTNGSVKGDVHYGTTANISGAGISGTTTNDSPIDFNAAKSSLSSQSSSLSQLAATGTYASNYGVTLTSSNTSLAVFNLTTAQLQAANGFGLNIVVPNGATVVINVDGTTGSTLNLSNFQMSINGSSSESNPQINKVLFNLTNVSTFTTSGLSILGSILAPNTALNMSNGHVDGTLIGASLTGGIEAHNYVFNGNLPSVAVPEPSSVVLLGLSAVGCGLFVRRQRRQTAA